MIEIENIFSTSNEQKHRSWFMLSSQMDIFVANGKKYAVAGAFTLGMKNFRQKVSTQYTYFIHYYCSTIAVNSGIPSLIL